MADRDDDNEIEIDTGTLSVVSNDKQIQICYRDSDEENLEVCEDGCFRLPAMSKDQAGWLAHKLLEFWEEK